MNHLIIYGISIPIDALPSLLDDLDLLPLLARRLIERKSCKDIQPTDQEQFTNLQQFLKKNSIGDQKELENWLLKNNLDEKVLSTKLFRFLQVEILKKADFSSQVESIYLNRKSNLDKVIYSLFRTKESAKAEEIYLRIDEKEDTFADLASQFSEGFEQQINGLIGPIEIGRINPHIAERLRISNHGQLWEPFKVDDWWVLLRLEKMIPAKLDEQMQNRIINELYENWIDKEVDQVISDLKSQTKPKSSNYLESETNLEITSANSITHDHFHDSTQSNDLLNKFFHNPHA